MKTTMTLLTLLVLFLPNTYPQEYTQLNLPEGAVACFGKGGLAGIQYSPDGTRLAVASTIGIWLYDTTTHREVALLTGHQRWVTSVAFSPDSSVIASGGGFLDQTVRLWDVKTGEQKQVFTGHTDMVADVAFSPDGKVLASASWDGTMLLWKVTD